MPANAYIGSHDIGDIAVLETVSIRAGNANVGNVDMRKFNRVFAYIELGAFNAADNVTTLKLQQDDGTATWKDLTTSSATGDYDTDTPLDADGNFAILEASDEDLDVDGGFYLVRLYVASTDNTGADNVTAFIFGCDAKDKYAERNGAAVAGEKAYVRPS